MKGELTNPLYRPVQSERVSINSLTAPSAACYYMSSIRLPTSLQLLALKQASSGSQFSRPFASSKGFPQKFSYRKSLLQGDGAALRGRWLKRLDTGLFKRRIVCSSERPLSNESPIAVTRYVLYTSSEFCMRNPPQVEGNSNRYHIRTWRDSCLNSSHAAHLHVNKNSNCIVKK